MPPRSGGFARQVTQVRRPAPLPTPGLSNRRAHSLGDAPPPAPVMPQPGPPHPSNHTGPESWPQFAGYVKLPAMYTGTDVLGNTVNSTASPSIKLRPEYFVCKRITFATVADIDVTTPLLMSSVQARAVECAWSDEFTKFFGSQPGLVAAAFGDSNGFLDLFGGILFQGSQTLTITLKRLIAVGAATPARWDFNFQGLSLLPPGQQSSGSMT
jgi:hypothetical protein